MRWPFRALATGRWRRRRNRSRVHNDALRPYQPVIRRLEDRRVLDVSAAFTSATGQLDILLANTADTANVSVSGGNIVVTDRQNQSVAVDVDGQGPGTVSASDIDAVRVAGDAVPDQAVVFHNPLPLPKGVSIEQTVERAEIRGDITRVSAGDIRIDAGVTQLDANLEVAGQNISFGGDVILSRDVTLTAVDVNFFGRVDDDGLNATESELLVRSSGVTRFSDRLGSAAALTRLETDAAGRTELSGDLFAEGGTILFADPVTLTGHASISDSGPTGILFGNMVDSAVDGHFRLKLSAANGRVEFNGNVGAGSAGDQRLGELIVEQAADGVLFGQTAGVTAVRIAGPIDIGVGTNVVGGEGIVLDGGTSIFQLETFGGSLRINGATVLQTDTVLATSDGNVMFTADAPVDSAKDRAQSLTIDAGSGAVFFNADIGRTTAVRGLMVTRAGGGVTFGTADVATPGGTGPVERIHSVDAIIVGSDANVIAAGLVFNAGAGKTMMVTTTGDDVEFHAAVTLNSGLSIDTGPGPGDIAFLNGPIDSRSGPAGLMLHAGGGKVSVSDDVGGQGALDSLIIIQADAGVTFGSDNRIPVGGPFPVLHVQINGPIDIGLGDNEIGGSGIVFNAGRDGLLVMHSVSLSASVRLNGPVTLDSDVEIFSGQDAIFTNDTPVDSRAGEANDLLLAAIGTISINEDLGRTAALGSLTVIEAKRGLTLGGATSEFPGTGGFGPVEVLRSEGRIDLGPQMNVIGGSGIILNGSANAGQQISTNGNLVRFNGAVTLGTDVSIATAGADIVFTNAASIDSAVGRTGSFVLDAGSALVRFNDDIGATRRIGSLTVTRADGGVRFGEASVELTGDNRIGPVTAIHTDQPIDIGVGANVVSGGIVLRGSSNTVLSTTNDDVRLNGPVRLVNDVAISTGDGLGNVTFTSAATIDSNDGPGSTTADQRVDLLVDAGDGSALFNANIGGDQPLDQLIVVRAAQAVVFGGADTAVLAGAGPVTRVRTDGMIDLGSGTASDSVIGSIRFNGGAATLVMQTSGDHIRVNGPTTLESPLSLITGPGQGDVTFTSIATLNSHSSETNPFDVTLDGGDATFEASLGDISRLGIVNIHSVDDLRFAASTTATRLVQELATGTSLFQGSVNTNHASLAGLDLTGARFVFQAPVLTTGNGRVTINHSALLDINPAAEMRLGGSFEETGGGPVELAADIATSGAPITFHDLVTLTDPSLGSILLSSVAGGASNGANINLLQSLNGESTAADNLLLNAGITGNITLGGPIGDVRRFGAITVVGANDVLASHSLAATRFVQLNGNGTTTFSGPVNLDHASLAALVAQTVNARFAAPVTTAGEGSLRITVSGALEITDAANMTLNGSFHQLGTGVVRAAADITTSNDDVLFGGPMTLLDNIVLDTGSGPGNVVFDDTLDGSQPLQQDLRIRVGEGDVRFGGQAGGIVPLGAVTIDQARDVLVGAPMTLGTLTQGSGSSETRIDSSVESQAVAGAISLRSRSIFVNGTLAGANSRVELVAAEVLTVEASITTNDTPLSLIADDDVLVGPLASVATRGGEITVVADSDLLNGGEVRMADGAVLTSQFSSITIRATDNIFIGRLVSPQPVILTSLAGGIADAGDSGGVNVESPALILRTATGVGRDDMIETRIATLAALNSGPGGIRITNDVDGLLTIGEASGLTGIVDLGAGKVEIINRGPLNVDRAILNDGDGDTILRAEFPDDLTVNAPIQNTGGNGFVSLFAGRDLVIHDSLPEPRDSDGHRVERPLSPQQFFEIMVVGEGGIRGEAGGEIRVDDSEQNYVIVHTDTGQVTNVTPLVKIETVNQGGSDIDQLGRGFVKVTLGDEVHLETNYHVTIDWGDGEIENFPIPGTINPLREQFQGNTDPRFISGEGEEQGEYFFLHKYFAHPNPLDPSAPIPIRVEVRHDPRSAGSTVIDGNRPGGDSAVFNGIRFSRAAGESIFTSLTDTFSVPGTGNSTFVKVVESVIVPVETRLPTPEPPLRAATSFSGTTGITFESTTVMFETEAQAEYRVFMRVVDDVLGREGDDIQLDEGVLDDPVAIFRKNRFPNGHYRIYLEEIRTHRSRLILDVHIYNGRVVPPNFQEGAGEKRVGAEQEQPSALPPPNQNGAVLRGDSDRDVVTTVIGRPYDQDSRGTSKSTVAIDEAPAVGAVAASVVGSDQWPRRAHEALASGTRSMSKAARLLRRRIIKH